MLMQEFITQYGPWRPRVTTPTPPLDTPGGGDEPIAPPDLGDEELDFDDEEEEEESGEGLYEEDYEESEDQ